MPLLPITKEDNIYFQYSQVVGGVVYNWCWFFSNLIAMSNLSNIKLEEKDLQWFIDELLILGYENKGYGIEVGAEVSIKLWNKKYPNNKMKNWFAIFDTPEMWMHIYKRKPLVLWINTGAKYWKDREDGVLNEMIYTRKDITSSHAIVLQKLDKTLYLTDSRGDGKLYKVSREYLTSVKGLLAKKRTDKNYKVLLFDRA